MKHMQYLQMKGERHDLSLRAFEQCPVLADTETSERGKRAVKAESLLYSFPGFSQ